MSFLDKMRAQAEQVVSQGQAKLDTMQRQKQADGLLRALGVAVYAEQRSGGDHAAVDAGLSALDEFSSTHGPIDTTGTVAQPEPSAASAPPPAAQSAPAAPPPAATPPPTGSDDFTL